MSASVTVLLDGIVTKTEQHDGYSTESFSLSGEPHANAVVEAVVRAFRTNVEPPTQEQVAELLGQPVTVLAVGEGMFGSRSIATREGKFFVGRNDTLGFLPKGNTKNGQRIDVSKLLGVVKGYNQIDVFAKQVDAMRSAYVPELAPLTIDDLKTLPDENDDDGDRRIRMAVFGTLPWFDQQRIPGCVWLLHTYIAEHDIAEGWLIVPPQGEAVSEHGSQYGERLVRFGGKVTTPIDMSGEEAVELCDAPYGEVIKRISRVAVPA